MLWETGRLAKNFDARFQTRSGLLTAERRGDAIELDFPVKPPKPSEAPVELLSALGVEASFVGHTGFDYFVLVDSAEHVRKLEPDHARLASLPVRGVIVTAQSNAPAFDFVSRFFAPGSGVAEDPVTGSAHCSLAPFWGERLGKTEMIGYQASKRGGVVRVRCAGERVKLGGKAVTVVRGEITA